MLKNPSRVLAADERRFTQIENNELDPILSAFICVYPRLRSVFQQPARTDLCRSNQSSRDTRSSHCKNDSVQIIVTTCSFKPLRDRRGSVRQTLTEPRE